MPWMKRVSGSSVLNILFLKYKRDEEALSISQSARLKYSHTNNEAQKVHSHGLFQVDEFRSLK